MPGIRLAFTADKGETSVVALGVPQVAPPSSEKDCKRWPPSPRATIQVFPLANSTTAGSPMPSGCSRISRGRADHRTLHPRLPAVVAVDRSHVIGTGTFAAEQVVDGHDHPAVLFTKTR